MRLLRIASIILGALINFAGIAYQDIKIGFYSGTFDPPTIAHNAIIRTAIDYLQLDKLYIFVNKNGEKNYKCSGQERVTMLERMLGDLKSKVIIIDQCTDKKNQDYMVLKKIMHEPIINITGQDSYERRLKIDPDKRINFDAIAIIPRSGVSSNIALEEKAFFVPIDQELVAGVSSTQVRQQLADRDFKNIALHPEVLNYIIEHDLYLYQPDKQSTFEFEYYAYIGKHVVKLPMPPFDPQASVGAWEENFYGWILHQKEK